MVSGQSPWVRAGALAGMVSTSLIGELVWERAGSAASGVKLRSDAPSHAGSRSRVLTVGEIDDEWLGRLYQWLGA